MMQRRTALAAAMIGFALVATACGAAAEKLSEEAVERAIESSGGGDVEFDVSGDGDDVTINIDSEEGSFSVGAGVEIPEQLQTPVPDGGNATQAGTQDDQVFVTIVYPAGQYEQIAGFYDEWTASTGSEWRSSTNTFEVDGEAQRSASWSTDDGSVYLYVNDCKDFSNEDAAADATCLTITESE